MACAVACDNDAIPAAQTTGAAVIGPEGGTVTSADGKIELVVPPGALDTELDMTLVATSFLPPAPLILAAFDFGPDGTEFQIPATLTFTYGEGDIPPGFTADQLRLAAAVNGRWVVLQVTHDPATRTISATVTHFSVYAAGVFPDNEPPTLLFLEPAQDLVVSHGGMVPIEYADDDPDDGAATIRTTAPRRGSSRTRTETRTPSTTRSSSRRLGRSRTAPPNKSFGRPPTWRRLRASTACSGSAGTARIRP
ncbi:MAG: hypothetical protein ACYTGI_15895 [Planctomycetota bacterium]